MNVQLTLCDSDFSGCFTEDATLKKCQSVAYHVEVGSEVVPQVEQDAREDSVEPHFHRNVWALWEDYKSGDHNYSLPANCLTQTKFLCNNLLLNDAACQLYTGLSLAAFNSVFEHLAPLYTETFQLHPSDQLLMTLMKFWNDFPQSELAEIFHVKQEEVSDILCYWIDLMEENMSIYIPWLPKKVIWATLPECFKKYYPDTTCILHYMVLPLRKKKNKDFWTVSFQHYFSQDSLKYLVAMAPCGLIMFISPVYGARSSDKFIAAHCGILEYLQPGNEVLVDQCFNVSDVFAQRKVRLISPLSHRLASHACSQEDIVDLRIHVEQNVFRLRRFKIISQEVPINLAPKLDKILRICAALCNLQSYPHKN